MANPFSYEVQLKAVGGKRKGALPFLYPWQYGRELHSDEDFYAMINAYKSWVYVAASKNAVSVANVPLRLYVAKGSASQKVKGFATKKITREQDKSIREDPFLYDMEPVRKGMEFEEVLQHPYLDLMKKVNYYTTSFELKESIQLGLELTGNTFLYLVNDKFGIPREIWQIPPQNCKILPDKKDFIKGYIYTKGGEEIFLDKKNVVHFKFANPRSQYYGYAPFNAIAEDFQLNNSINEFETKLFENSGTLSGLFETDGDLGEHEYLRLREEIKGAFSGAKNAGKLALLDNGVHYRPLGISPKEMSYLGGRKLVKENILNAYGVVLSLFSDAANRANVEGGLYLYYKQTIAPRLARNQEKLNRELISRYSPHLFLKYDDCVPEDRDAKLNERIKNIQTSVSAVDEERLIMGRKPLGGIFSEPFIPVNYTTAEGILANIAEGTGSGNVISSPEKMLQLLEKE